MALIVAFDRGFDCDAHTHHRSHLLWHVRSSGDRRSDVGVGLRGTFGAGSTSRTECLVSGFVVRHQLVKLARGGSQLVTHDATSRQRRHQHNV